MTRTVLRVCSLLIAGLLGVVAAHVAGRHIWVAVPAVVAVWLVIAALGGLARSRVTAFRLRREGPGGATARAFSAMAALERVSAGAPGFTDAGGGLSAFEHAVLLGPGIGPRRRELRKRLHDAVRAEVARSSAADRARLVEGLVTLADAAMAASRSPLHALHPVATPLLSALAIPERSVPWIAVWTAPGGRTRAPDDPGSWSKRRAFFDPRRPEQPLAVRLLAAGYGHAALEVLRMAPNGGPVDRLRRLARSACLLEGSHRGGLPPELVARWYEELLLLAGRRLQDLSPNSRLMKTVPGGAAALERAVARTPIAVAQFAELARLHPELERSVATVVARIVSWPIGTVVTALRDGSLSARPDSALRLHLRGLALLEEGRSSEAAAEFEAALVQSPGFAQAAFALATTRRRAGRAAEGEGILLDLTKLVPGDPDPVVFLARYLSSIGERERAREAFEDGVKRFPDSVPLRVAFAQELVSWGCGAEAADQLERARDEHPDEPRLALLAGRTLASESRLGEAARALEKAARGLSGRERAEAWFWLMGVRREQGDHTTAERIARRLIGALGAGQSNLLDEVAEYLEERHDYLRAREAAERARRLRERGDGAG